MGYNGTQAVTALIACSPPCPGLAGNDASAHHACSQVADIALIVWQNVKP